MSQNVPSPLEPYYSTLDAGDMDALPALFTEDAVYIRPDMGANPGEELGAMVAMNGREEIADFFRRRGKRNHHHRILFAATNGASCFVEGRGGGAGTPLHAFAAHALLDEAGLIKRYIAFVSWPDTGEVVDSSVGFDNAEFKT